MIQLEMLEEDIQETTPTEVNSVSEQEDKDEEYKFEFLEPEPMEMDQTP